MEAVDVLEDDGSAEKHSHPGAEERDDGIIEFLRACLTMTTRSARPMARAVRR